MRVHLWLVVCLVSRLLVVAAAEAAPPDSMPPGDAAEEAVVIDAPHVLDMARARVTVRVYSSTNLAADAQRASLDVAKATFAAASVQIVWKICARVSCDTPLSPAEFVVRMCNWRMLAAMGIIVLVML